MGKATPRTKTCPWGSRTASENEQVKNGARRFVLLGLGVALDLVVGVVDLQKGVAEEEGVGAGFGVGGHGEAVDLDVVAGNGGLAGKDGGALRGRAFEADYGVVGGVDPHFAGEEVGAFAERLEGDEDARVAVEFDDAGLGVEVVVF